MSNLEGCWQQLYAELEGQPAPVEVLHQTEFEIRGGHYFVRFGRVTADTGALFVETDAGHHLTLRGTAGPNAGRTIPCLFKFIDDTLMICFGLGGTRPPNFRTAPDSQLYLCTYRRK